VSDPEDNAATEHEILRPRRRIFISTSSVFLANLIVALLGTVALRVMTVNLGPASYGVFVTGLRFVGAAILLTDLGVNSMTGREIARSPDDAHHILGANVALRVALSVVVIPIVSIAGWVAYSSHAHSHDLVAGIVIIAFAIPFDAVRAVSLAYFVSRIENHRTAIINLLSQLLFVAFAITAVLTHRGVIGCFWAYLAATMISSAVALWFTVGKVRFRPVLSLSRWMHVVRQSVSIGLIQVVNAVYLSAGIIIMSLYLSSSAVGHYGVAAAITSFFLIIPVMYMTSTLPLMTRADEGELYRLVRSSVADMSVVGSLVAAGCICVGPGVIRVLAGAKFSQSATPLAILSVAVILTGVTSVFGFANFSQDRHHRMLYVSVGGLVLNICLNVIVVPTYGINGAATVMIASEALILLGTYWVFRTRVGQRIPVFSRVVRAVCAGVVTVVLFKVVLTPNQASLAQTVLAALGVTVFYLAVLAVFGGWTDEMKSLARRVRRA